MTLSNRTFGVELEVILNGKTRAGVAQEVRRATGINIREERYGHTVPNTWKIVTDGSIGHQNGEVVSPVLSGEEGLEQARKITEALKAAGCTVNPACGFHVHVGAGDLDLNQLRKLAVNFVHAETAMDCIMPVSRRADKNTYVQSNRSGFGGETENQKINNAIKAYERAQTKAALITHVSSNGSAGGASRYRKLNFQALNRQPSVEFRQHQGTVESEKVVNWVRLCVAFVDRSMVSRPRPRTALNAKHVETAELGQLLTWLRLEPEACKFFRARRKEFSQRAVERAAQQQREAAARAEAERLAAWEADAPARAIREAEAAAQAAREEEARHTAVAQAAAEAERVAREQREARAVEQTRYFAERRAAAEAALAAALSGRT
ncbi:amidoligase family protein [Bradyrhizobium sp. RT10b]|uniref:amidoligase family protein n=1 Tax=Bradyrhizobium sp. RT10b TaxID=3156331 RepID=UPI003393D73B